ncbi:MAG: hypothetical protein AUH30_02280 [Candidatus Rokubacteria bacterium 13_1_40CM_68_15]|nr:MAG: hypothetical protein AUH30_02280 [Candidatus Rokubacteria bacterium 13_1_40CM_68_15]
MIERIPASRCSRCGLIVAPPATYCPHHPARMIPTTVAGIGEIVSYTTLHSAPEGFRSPLHIALVQLQGGARFVCHGAQTRRVRIGSLVAIEAVDNIYYFSSLNALDRARLFWGRAGRAGDRVNAMTRSVVRRLFKGGESGPN